MSHSTGSHAWCQCLHCVYSASSWEISHQATTWTRARPSPMPGTHLELICLPAANNEDVIPNLAPCVRYGERGLAFICVLCSVPETFQSDSTSTRFPPIPSENDWNSLTAAKNSHLLCLGEKKRRGEKKNTIPNSQREVTNGCHALWRPIKIKHSAKWNQRAAGR